MCKSSELAFICHSLIYHVCAQHATAHTHAERNVRGRRTVRQSTTVEVALGQYTTVDALETAVQKILGGTMHMGSALQFTLQTMFAGARKPNVLTVGWPLHRTLQI